MSISPPSDIVLGVTAAADPEKYRAAVARLTQLGNGAASADAANSAQFTVPTAPATQSASAPATSAAGTSATPATGRAALSPSSGAPSSAQTASAERELKAYKQLEAFLMQTYIESMLPKDASSVYGKGMAGDFWRSMLAEHTANEVAQTATLGIAESILKAKAKQNKSLTTGAEQASTASPGALNATLLQLQSIAGGNAQVTAVTSTGTSALARQGS